MNKTGHKIDEDINKLEESLDNPSYNWWQSLIMIMFALSFGAWAFSGDLEKAGFISADPPAVVVQNPADDPDDIHYLLITVAANQAAADAAYKKGADVLRLKNQHSVDGMIANIEQAAAEVDRGVVRMANAKEEKTKTIANVKARQDMRDGLHLLWHINTVRRNHLQEISAAFKSGSLPALQAVAQKYKEVMPSLEPSAIMALAYFSAAKTEVGLKGDLREFVQ